MKLQAAIIAAICTVALAGPALARSPLGGVNDLVRKARQVENRVKSTIQREKSRIRPVPKPYPNPIVKPGPKPFPIPNPIIKPGPKPRPIPNPIIDPLPGPAPIILPGPGPLPSPQPQPEPIDDNVTLPWPRPVIVINPRPCPAPQPRPVPIVEPIEPPAHDSGDAHLPVLHEAQTVNLPIDGLSRSGRVVIKLGPILASAKLIEWGPETVVFELPTVGLAEVAPATLELLTEDGRTLASIDFNFAPPMPVAEQLPQVPAGSRLTLNGDDFGSQQGSVWVQIGQIRLNATVLGWTESEAVVLIPELELANPAAAELVIADGTGEVVERAAIELVAAR